MTYILRIIHTFILLCGTFFAASAQTNSNFYIQSLDDNLISRMTGKSLPADKKEWAMQNLRHLHVLYIGTDGKSHEGELVCNKSIAQDLLEIFSELYKIKYKIESLRLVDDFDGNDDRSMEANNTSCFNYRTVSGTNRLSMHGKGLAIDINPFYNPWVRGQRVDPVAARKYAFNRTKVTAPVPIITTKDPCYRLFIKHGFTWGGAWKSSKDYQHFEKK